MDPPGKKERIFSKTVSVAASVLHNTGGRYEGDQGILLANQEGSMVFSQQIHNIRRNVVHSDAMELYLGNEMPENHALNWLKTKRGILPILPTGSVKVECSLPERKVVSLSHSRVIPKT